MGVAQAPGRIGNDPGFGGTPRLGASERIYAGLLRAYPSAFRRRYEDEMVLLFADQLRDARAASGAAGTTVTWFRTVLDLVSSAIGEHFRKDRTMAQSLTTFEPSRTMRLLGLIGVTGAGLLLMAFITFAPFENVAINTIRLLAFGLSGVAISIAFYGRQARISPLLALASTAAVVIAGLWYTLWDVVSLGLTSRYSGTFGWIGVFASLALWVTPTFYGAAMLRIGAAWQGMSKWRARVTRVAALLLLGSFMAVAGDDHWGLVDSEAFGQTWTTIALLGVLLNGAGWLLLGAVLLLGRSGDRGHSGTFLRTTNTTA